MGRKNGQNPTVASSDEAMAKHEDLLNDYAECDDVDVAIPEVPQPHPKRKRVCPAVTPPCVHPVPSSTSGSYGFQPVRQRQTANARERDRTHSVNSAFTTLRTLIPTEPADRKLSKIETLRLASSYISHLATILVSGADLRDQPCLRHQFYGGGSEPNGGVRSVCTFCLSGVKKTKPQQQQQQEGLYYTPGDLPAFMYVRR